ncbi:MAG: peptidoglycan recognition protein family protein [Planctomycetes bacterium]|nr:peptidoglycan recognition protein family protein [Planctomycetota bacterium]
MDTIPAPDADDDPADGDDRDADAAPAGSTGADIDAATPAAVGATDRSARPDSLETSGPVSPDADGGEQRKTRSSTRHAVPNTTATPADSHADGRADGRADGPVRDSARLAAAGDTVSGTAYVHPDGGSMSSQRLRLIPPDGKPFRWWYSHREKIELAETILSGLFLLLALYFLYLWFFSGGDVAYDPSREGFVQALAALPAVRPELAWRVRATPGRWRNIVVHHTATKTGSAESIDRYHREVNKWENGLGYHFIIGNGHGMADGEVAMSRRWREQLDGAHVRMKGSGKANSWCIGIALVGNFEEEVASPRQLAALRGLLAFLLQEYGIKNEEIVGHGQVAVNYTACPGKLFFLNEVLKTL